MAKTNRQNILVVVQLTGANDFMNTVVPYANPLYQDNRPTVGIPAEQVLPIDHKFGFCPSFAPIKELYDRGTVAILNGVGYPNPNRSHFRSMDIWHTCEPEKIVSEGWLGKAIRDLDHLGENVVTGVNIGRGLPRAMAMPGVPVASVGDLDSYGVLNGFAGHRRQLEALDTFARMYAPAVGTGAVMDYLGRTGRDALMSADLLQHAPARYTSGIEYSDTPIARSLQAVAKLIMADLGTRVFYTQHAGYDTHANQAVTQPQLLEDLSQGLSHFFADLQEHQRSDDVLVYIFTEFGRRVKDNGAGTDHGSGGGGFVIGDAVKGGMYGEYPSLKDEDLLEGDLHFSQDFRGVYSTILDKWLGLEPAPIVGGHFEQPAFL